MIFESYTIRPFIDTVSYFVSSGTNLHGTPSEKIAINLETFPAGYNCGTYTYTAAHVGSTFNNALDGALDASS
jgi:hypothetical protein